MSPRPDLRDPPLRPAVFHILLALAARPLHGLGIADAIEADTAGTVELGPGTLYRSLSEMVDAGLIEPASAPSTDADPRRKYYAITRSGRDLAASESRRLARLVEAARARDLLPERA
jgi:DNA-binding PadR family transcriptional regulator